MAKKIWTVESMEAAAYWNKFGIRQCTVQIGREGVGDGVTQLRCYYNPANLTRKVGTFDYTVDDIGGVSRQEAAAILTRQKALVKKPGKAERKAAKKAAKPVKADTPKGKKDKPAKAAEVVQ